MGCLLSTPKEPSPVAPVLTHSQGNASNNAPCTLRIVAVNDVYDIRNFAHYATCRKQAAVGPTLTIGVLPGDFVAPSILSSLDKGVGMIECMSAAGIDYVCIGNHENDIPFPQLMKRIDQSRFVWVNSNMTNFREYDAKTPEYVILELEAGVDKSHKRRVALLGLNTEDRSILRQHAFNDAIIEPVADTLARLVEKLKTELNVDMVIPMTHQVMPRDRDLAKMGLGVPLILGGHDHEPFLETYTPSTGLVDHLPKSATPRSLGGCTIVKTGMDAESIAICDVVWRDATAALPEVSVSLKGAKDYAEDPAVAEVIGSHAKVLDELHSSTLWALPSDVVFSSQRMRYGPTTAGVFICSVIRDSLSTDCALVPAGSIRGDTNYKDRTHFTYADLKSEMPFPAEMIVVDLPGRVINDTVAFSRADAVLDTPVEKGYFLQADDGLTWDRASNTVRAIKGEPIQLDRMYKVAISQMHMAGFENITPLVQYSKSDAFDSVPADSGMGAKEIIVDYFSKKIWADLLTKNSFESMDMDGSGYIDKDELYAAALKSFGAASRIMVDNLFAIADDSGDGRISMDEILNITNKSTDELRANTKVVTI